MSGNQWVYTVVNTVQYTLENSRVNPSKANPCQCRNLLHDFIFISSVFNSVLVVEVQKIITYLAIIIENVLKHVSFVALVQHVYMEMCNWTRGGASCIKSVMNLHQTSNQACSNTRRHIVSHICPFDKSCASSETWNKLNHCSADCIFTILLSLLVEIYMHYKL